MNRSEWATIESHMVTERKECDGRDRCALSVVLLDDGTYRARLRFQPGQESAWAHGSSISEAIAALSVILNASAQGGAA